MRITAIHVYQHDLPIVGGPFRMATTCVDALDTTIVQVVTDAGISGWGETCPVGPVYQPHHALGARAALAELAPPLVGTDPLTTGPARARMDSALAGHDYAKAALDIALWDLAGRHFDRAVHELLGGARMPRVPSYYAVGVGEPAETADIARARGADGFNQIQIKLGGRPVEADIETAHRIHERVGARARLVADANRGWSTRDALLFSRACAGLPLILEQPCDTIDEIATVRHQLCHPVYLDESATDLAATLGAIGSRVCDGFGFKLTRAGGIGPMRAIRDVCQACSLPYSCNDAWGGDIIAAACVHVAATGAPTLVDATWVAAPFIETHYDPEHGVRVTDGEIDIPSGPGLGLQIDPSTFGTPVATYNA